MKFLALLNALFIITFQIKLVPSYVVLYPRLKRRYERCILCSAYAPIISLCALIIGLDQGVVWEKSIDISNRSEKLQVNFFFGR